jgi:hypothetical protein
MSKRLAGYRRSPFKIREAVCLVPWFRQSGEESKGDWS